MPLEDGMKRLSIRIEKGEDVTQDIVAMVESALMDASIQFAGTEDQQMPEGFMFLTAKENIEIIVKNWRKK